MQQNNQSESSQIAKINTPSSMECQNHLETEYQPELNSDLIFD